MVDEEIPLTKDVVKPPPKEFVSTFSEWAADNVEQVIISRVMGADTTMYVVPDNFTLFITNAWISIVCSGGAGVRRGHITINNAATEILGGVQITASQGHAEISTTFPMPIKVTSKNPVGAGASAGSLAHAGFTGFLLPKKISIR